LEQLEPRHLLSVSPLGGEEPVNSFLAGSQALHDSGTGVAAYEDGSFLAVWSSQEQDGDGLGIYGQRFDAGGDMAGAEFRVNSNIGGDQYRPVASIADDGSSVVLWQSDGQDASLAGVFGQRFDATNSPLGSEFLVNTTTKNDQEMPAVTHLADGGFVAAWSGRGQGDNAGVFARVFDADGTPLGSEFLVNTHTQQHQEMASVAATTDGGFVAAWSSRGNGNAADIYARRFDASGTPLSEEFQVNTGTHTHQSDPSIAADPQGGFGITWQSKLQDGSGIGVFAQRFDASGAPLGGEFQANETAAGDQQNPSLAFDSQGGFLVAWSGASSADTNGVVARKYGSDGGAQGGEFQVNTTLDGVQAYPTLTAGSSGYVVGWSGQGAGDADGVFLRRFGSPPAVFGVPAVHVNEDSADTHVDLFAAFEDPENIDAQLTFELVGNTNLALFSSTTIDASTGDLQLSYALNAFGTADLTVRATDPGGLSAEAVFTVNEAPVNDAPTTSGIADINVLEDAPGQTVNLLDAFDDVDNTDAELTFELVGNTNPGLFSATAVDSSAGHLQLAYAANAYGSADLTIRATDPDGLSAQAVLTVNVAPVNDAPTTIGLASFCVLEDSADSSISLWPAFHDVDNADAELTFSIADNTNPDLFSSLVINATTGQLTLDYAPDANGTVEITVRGADPDGLFAEAVLGVFVQAVNDAPTTPGIADINVLEDALDETIDLLVAFDDVDNTDAELTFELVGNTNPGLFASATLDSSAGNLQLAYALNAFGTADLTVRASDPGGLSAETVFTVNVAPVNDTPTASGLADVAVDEDADSTVIDLFPVFADIEDADAALTFSVADNTNPALFASTDIDPVAGTLSLDYAPDAFGTAVLTVRGTDTGGLFAETALHVTIAPINDPPVGTPMEISVPSGTVTSDVSLFGIFDDVDDADETLTYSAMPVARADMFSSWAIDPATGVMTLQYTFGKTGLGQIVVTARDPSGRWTDTNVLVEIYNTAPTVSAIPDVTVDEDAPATLIDLTAYFDDAKNTGAGLTYEVAGNTNPQVAVASIGEDGQLTLAYPADANGTSALTIRGTDTEGLSVETAFSVTVLPVNDPPRIAYLLDSPDPTFVGSDLTLLAVDVVHGSPDVTVEFYRDADGNRAFDPASDQLLATSDGEVLPDGSQTWQVTVSTADFGKGPQAYFARAIDTEGLAGTVAMAVGSVGVVGILDNSQVGYAETGTGWTDGATGDGFGGGWRTSPAGTGQNAATWTFTGTVAGLHRVFVTFPADGSLATDATYNVYDGAALVGTFTVDQTQTPDDLFTGDTGWVSLGEMDITSGTLVIELVDSASGPVAADAVRVVDPPPVIQTLSANHDLVLQGADIRLTADGVSDTDGTVSEVSFYRDADGNGTLDTGTDDLLGFDLSDGDGWWLAVDTTSLAVGDHTFFAVATDNDSLQSSPVSTAATVASPVSGLAAWYPFTSDAADAAGTNDGTLQGDALVVADAARGQVLELDGSGDYASLGDPASLNITGQITLAAWIKPEATNGLRNILVRGHAFSPNGEVFLRIANGNYQVGSWNGSNHLASSPIPASDVGQWVHLTGVYDGTHWRLYRNGVEIASQVESTGAVAVATGWAIGARATGTERFFEGTIDDARIYDRGLSAAEVHDLGYENYAPELDGAMSLFSDTAADNELLVQLSATDHNTNETFSYAITAGNEQALFAVNDNGEITVADSALLATDDVLEHVLSVTVTDGGTPALSDTVDVTLRRETIPAGLLGHWRLDDAAGATAEDWTGVNDGVYQGEITATEGPLGNAAVLDGSGDYVALGNPAELDITGEISLSAWIKPEATDGYRNIIVRGYSRSPNGEVFLRIANGNYQVGSWNGADHLASAAIPAEDIGNWAHLTGVYDGTHWRLYRNGVEIASQEKATGAVAVADGWAIGARATGTGRFFQGEIDEARIYGRGLSEAEVSQLATTYQNMAPTLAGATLAVVANPADGHVVGQVAAHDPITRESVQYAITSGDTAGVFAIDSEGTITVADPVVVKLGDTNVWQLTVTATDDGPSPLQDSADVVIYRDVVLDGLAGHWRLDEASGITTAVDAAGVNDGSLQGNAAMTGDGERDQVLQLDGAGDYVALGNPSELNITGEITLSAWIKPQATNGLRNIVAHGHAFSPNGEVFLRIANGNYQVGSWNGSNHFSSTPIPAEDVGVWVHLTGVYDGTDWRLYRNGVEVASAQDSVGAVTVNGDWAVGARGTGTQRFFQGQIDDVRIYPRGLSPEEADALAGGNQNLSPVLADASFEISADALAGAYVGTISATDPEGTDILYAITGGNESGAFAIGPDTGMITVADVAALDFATHGPYALTVTAVDDGLAPQRSSSTVTITENTLTAGLSGHWRFDETSGDATAIDSAGANAGTLQGDAAIVSTTDRGQAVHLDGQGDYVSLGAPAELNITGEITLSAWIRPEATNGVQNIIVRGHAFSPNGEVFLRIANGNYQVGSWNGSNHLVSSPIPASDVGQWVHLTGVYDGTHWRLYRNGVEIASQEESTGAVAVASGWAIGARATGTERFFQGDIDDARILARGLTPAETAALAAQPALPSILGIDVLSAVSQGDSFDMTVLTDESSSSVFDAIAVVHDADGDENLSDDELRSPLATDANLEDGRSDVLSTDNMPPGEHTLFVLGYQSGQIVTKTPVTVNVSSDAAQIVKPRIGGNPYAFVDQEYSLQVDSGSYSMLDWTVNWGDGSPDQTPLPIGDTTVPHTYSTPDNHTITVTATRQGQPVELELGSITVKTIDTGDLIVNGGFEDDYDPSDPDWTTWPWNIFPSGEIAGWDADYDIELQGLHADPPNPFVELDADQDGPGGGYDPDETGQMAIYQTLSTIPGALYELSFNSWPRRDIKADNVLQVGVGGETLVKIGEHTYAELDQLLTDIANNESYVTPEKREEYEFVDLQPSWVEFSVHSGWSADTIHFTSASSNTTISFEDVSADDPYDDTFGVKLDDVEAYSMIPVADIDVDSNNDGDTDLLDDPIEDQGPGKILATGINQRKELNLQAIFSSEDFAGDEFEYTLVYDESTIAIYDTGPSDSGQPPTGTLIPSNTDLKTIEGITVESLKAGLTLYVDGVNLGATDIEFKVTRGSLVASDKGRATVALDLDTDSDNTGTIDGTTEEDKVEDWMNIDPTKKGREVFVGDSLVAIEPKFTLASEDLDGFELWLESSGMELYADEDKNSLEGVGAEKDGAIYKWSVGSGIVPPTTVYSETTSFGTHRVHWRLVNVSGDESTIVARDTVLVTITAPIGDLVLTEYHYWAADQPDVRTDAFLTWAVNNAGNPDGTPQLTVPVSHTNRIGLKVEQSADWPLPAASDIRFSVEESGEVLLSGNFSYGEFGAPALSYELDSTGHVIWSSLTTVARASTVTINVGLDTDLDGELGENEVTRRIGVHAPKDNDALYGGKVYAFAGPLSISQNSLLLSGDPELAGAVQGRCDSLGADCNISIGSWADVATELGSYDDGSLSYVYLVGHSSLTRGGVRVADGQYLSEQNLPDDVAQLIDRKLSTVGKVLMGGCCLAQDDHGSAERMQDLADKIGHSVIANLGRHSLGTQGTDGQGLWLIFRPET